MKVLLIVLGCLTALLGAGCTAHSGWMLSRVHADGFFEGAPARAAIQSPALVTEEQGPIPIDGGLRVRAESRNPDKEIFIGVAPVDAFATYTDGASFHLITDFAIEPTMLAIQPVQGNRDLAPPGAQSFWLAAVSGAGEQEMTWTLEDESYHVLIMNADGSPGVDADVTIGLRLSFYEPKALAYSALLGVFVLAGGVLIVVAAVRRKPPLHYPEVDPSMPPPPPRQRGPASSEPPPTV